MTRILTELLNYKLKNRKKYDKKGTNKKYNKVRFKKDCYKKDVKSLGKQLSLISEDLKRSNKLEVRVADIENVLNNYAQHII